MRFFESGFQLFAFFVFAAAVGHTFVMHRFHRLAARFPARSLRGIVCRLLGEVEIVFGVWALVALVGLGLGHSGQMALGYLRDCHFSEPIFVFAVLLVCATRPLMVFAERAVILLSRVLGSGGRSVYVVTLVLGPLLGSVITEPAAMSVTALILWQLFYQPAHGHRMSLSLKYATLGLLFVNVSIGGVLTPYAAPPVLMVARSWGWDLSFMLGVFGWKAIIAIGLSTFLVATWFSKELETFSLPTEHQLHQVPVWVSVLHMAFLGVMVVFAHEWPMVLVLLMGFVGFVWVTSQWQDKLRFRDALGVGIFLSGLVVLGGLQKAWVASLISGLSAFQLFIGAIGLTAIVDNAILTYLGSLVPHLSTMSQYALVAGAVAGGGLTIIANGANPIGYRVLNDSFGEDGIRALRLALYASFPTLIAALSFWVFRG